jgi:hypothetical protein
MAFGLLKTRTRIYAGFSTLIALGLVVAAVGSWGTDSLGRQSIRMNALSGNLRYVATAVENEQLIARLLLQARDEPSDQNKARLNGALDKVREALTQAKAKTLSTVRKDIYQATLDKLEPLAQSADKTFNTGRTMVDGRARLFTGGDALTDATSHLAELGKQANEADETAATTTVERAMLLVRVANWRFLATRDKAGPATFHTNAAAAARALDAIDKFPALAEAATPVRAALNAYVEAFDVTAPALLNLVDAYNTVQQPMVNTIQAELAKAA